MVVVVPTSPCPPVPPLFLRPSPALVPLGVAAIKSTQDMAGQGAANAAQYIKLYVDLSGSSRRKLCPIRRTETETTTGIPFNLPFPYPPAVPLFFWGGGIPIRFLHLLEWHFVSLSLFIDLFFVPPSPKAGAVLFLFSSLTLSFFSFFLSFEDFICVLIFD